MDDKIVEFILRAFGYGGGAAIIAYYIFKHLCSKWIEQKFSERMEDYKHKQQLELEDYKYKINSLFNRVTKIHEKEFEALPIAWEKLQNAVGHVIDISKPLQTYPDLNKMVSAELEEFLKSTKFTQSQKEQILSATNKIETYRKIKFRYRLSDATQQVSEFQNFILHNRIFLSKDIYAKFGEIDFVLRGALVDVEVGDEDSDRKMISDAYKEVEKKANNLIPEIEQLVQARLQFCEVDDK